MLSPRFCGIAAMREELGHILLGCFPKVLCLEEAYLVFGRSLLSPKNLFVSKMIEFPVVTTHTPFPG